MLQIALKCITLQPWTENTGMTLLCYRPTGEKSTSKLIHVS